MGLVVVVCFQGVEEIVDAASTNWCFLGRISDAILFIGYSYIIYLCRRRMHIHKFCYICVD